MSQSKKWLTIAKIIILIALVILGLFPTKRVLACSCDAVGTPKEEFELYDAVFTGEVVSINEIKLPDSDLLESPSFYTSVKVGIIVEHSWKGVITDFTYVYTGHGGGDCGYPLTGFETYLFYASGPINNLNISICSRTALTWEADNDLTYLSQRKELPLTHVVLQNNNDLDGPKKDKTVALLGTATTVLLIMTTYLIVVNQKIKKNIKK